MKTKITIATLLFGFTVNAQLDKMEDVGIVTHFKGRPFTGVGFRLHENGELKLECTFKDGLKHGKTFYSMKMDLLLNINIIKI